MKRISLRRSLIAGRVARAAVVLLTFVALSAISVYSQTQETAQNVARLQHLPSLQINHNLPVIVQTDPNLIRVNRREPIPFVPFEMQDPATRRVIAPNTMLTLPDGKRVQADEYFAALNRIEKGLNDLGYSLRNMPDRLVLQETIVNTSELRQQSLLFRSLGTIKPQDELMRRFIADPVAENGQRVLRADELTPNLAVAGETVSRRAEPGGAVRPALPSVSLEWNTNRPGLDYKNFELTEARPELCQQACADDPNCKAFTYVKPGVQGPRARCWLKSAVPEAGPGDCCVSGVKTTPRTATGMILINPAILTPKPKTFHHEEPWDWGVGSASSFRAYVKGKFVLDGKAYPMASPSDADLYKSNTEFTLSGEAQAGGSILGKSADILRLSARFYAPANSSKPMNMQAKVEVMGSTIYSPSEDIYAKWEKSDTISYGVNFKAPFAVPIGPVTLTGVLGAKGDAGFRYGIKLTRASARGSIEPFVHTSVYGEGGPSIVVAGAGVGAEMNLLNAEMSLWGNAGLGWLGKWFLFDELYGDYKLNLLGGRVYGYVYVYVPCADLPPWCKKQWEHNFWNWSGFKKEGVLIDAKNTFTFDKW